MLSSDIVVYASGKRIWLVGQGVKTPPSHGGIMGSIPVRATGCQVLLAAFLVENSYRIRFFFGNDLHFIKKCDNFHVLNMVQFKSGLASPLF